MRIKTKLIKLISCTIAAGMMLSSAPASAVEIESFSENLNVYFNGIDVYSDNTNKPIIINDRTMVQIKPIFELMGFTSDYNDTTKEAVFTNADKSQRYSFIAEDYNIYKITNNFKESTQILDVPATIYNDTFYVPLRGFCDAFGISIEWIDTERKVAINGGNASEKKHFHFLILLENGEIFPECTLHILLMLKLI